MKINKKMVNTILDKEIKIKGLDQRQAYTYLGHTEGKGKFQKGKL